MFLLCPFSDFEKSSCNIKVKAENYKPREFRLKPLGLAYSLENNRSRKIKCQHVTTKHMFSVYFF